MSEERSSKSGATQTLIADVGRDVSEYGFVRFEAPVGASPEEIARLAREAALDYVENDEEAFSDAEIGDINGLRVVGIYDGNRKMLHERFPLEPNYYEIGAAVQDGVKLLDKGVYTENQFILETLHAVFRNNPESKRNEILSKSLLESFENAARRDSLRKIESLTDLHQGKVSQETGPVAITKRNEYGEMANVVAQPPSLIADGDRIFYAFRRAEDGRTALVSREADDIRVVWDTGEIDTFAPDIVEFGKRTGLTRVPAHESEVALRIIEDLRDRVPEREPMDVLPNEQADQLRAEKTSGERAGDSHDRS